MNPIERCRKKASFPSPRRCQNQTLMKPSTSQTITGINAHWGIFNLPRVDEELSYLLGKELIQSNCGKIENL